MPALENQRHETFAKHLAQGKSASESYKAAGYQACRQSASRLSAKADIRERVVELQAKASTPPDMNGRDEETGQFLKGYSRGGRPIGSRVKLGERFLADLHRKWEQCGQDVLDRVERDEPATLMRTVASLMPRELETSLNVNVLFQDCADYHSAWRLAQQVIGSDQPTPDGFGSTGPLLIEGEVEEGEMTGVVNNHGGG